MWVFLSPFLLCPLKIKAGWADKPLGAYLIWWLHSRLIIFKTLFNLVSEVLFCYSHPLLLQVSFSQIPYKTVIDRSEWQEKVSTQIQNFSIFFFSFWRVDSKFFLLTTKIKLCSLTLYTLIPACIFSILFLIYFLRCWQGEFVKQSRAPFIVDHFSYSCDLNEWFWGDIVRRN